MLRHLVLLHLWTANLASAQDSGQAAARLATLVNGTVPTGEQFRTKSTNITSNNRLGLLSIQKASQVASSKLCVPQMQSVT